ncbi:MAG: ABC transporter substrate-binding protein [Bacteroidota bacterium]
MGLEDQIKAAVAKFNEKYPGWKVEISCAADFEAKIKVALGAKEGLDVMWSGGSDYPQIWGEQGALVPLDPYIRQEKIKMYDVYEKPYVDELKYKGKQVLLPTDCFTYALWYNKVLFDQAGVPYPAPDKSYSWEELLEVGKKLTRDTDGDGKIDVWGLSLLTPTWHIVQPWYNSCGAQILSKDGRKAHGYVDSAKFIDFVTKYRDLIWKYKIAIPLNIPPDGDAWSIAWSNGFLAGKVAMHVSAPWMIPEANGQEEKHPKLLKWATALPPRLSGSRPYSIGGTAGWGIPVTCPKEKRLVAFRLIWELAAGAGAEYWYSQGKMWTTKVGMKNFRKMNGDRVAGWIEAVKYLVPMEQIGKMAWKSAVEPNLIKYISAAVVNRMDPAEACKQAAKAMDEGIAKYEASNL